MNKVILLGNIGQDAELRFAQSGTPVLSFGVATTETRSVDGQTQKYTSWHRCVIFGKRAEGLSKHLTRGKAVAVEGSIRYREFETQAGQKRSVAEIHVFELEFAGGRNERRDQHEGTSSPDDDDVPF